MICPHTLVAHILADLAVSLLTALCLGFALTCLAMAVLVEAKDRQERKRERQVPELPPAPEAPHVPAPARDQLARAEFLRVAYVARRRTKEEREDAEAVNALIREVSRG